MNSLKRVIALLTLTLTAFTVPTYARSTSSSSRPTQVITRQSTPASTPTTAPAAPKSVITRPASTMAPANTRMTPMDRALQNKVAMNAPTAPTASKPLTAATPAVVSRPNNPVASPRVTEMDRALQNKVAMKGATFRSRNDAIQAIRAAKAAEYKTHFPAEPNQRPPYIPQTYRLENGGMAPIYYDANRQGYGYVYQGSWHQYDPLDAAIADALLRQNGYGYDPNYYPAPQQTTYVPAPVAVQQDRWAVGEVMLLIVVGLIGLFILVKTIR